MNFSLTSTFQDELEFLGKEISLDLSFDNVLRLFEMFADEAFSSMEKVEIALEILLTIPSYESVRPFNMKVKHSLFLYIMKEFLDMDLEKQQTEKKKPVHDWIQDAGIIYSSFLAAYNMDLFEQQGKLHWKKFLELFINLPDTTKMKEVIGYRSEKIPARTKQNDEERKRLIRMKKLYKLKGVSSDEENAAQISENEQNFNMLALMFRSRSGGEQ